MSRYTGVSVAKPSKTDEKPTIANYDYKMTQNITHNFQSQMKLYHRVLYIKKIYHITLSPGKSISRFVNLVKLERWSKFTLTVGHPVFSPTK